MSLTLGRGMIGRVLGAAPAIYDLSARSLTFWYKPDFSASPWTPSASAGSSGSNGNLAEGTNPPGTTAALNGKIGAEFDGTNDELSNGTAVGSVISAAAGSIGVLFNADAAAADLGPTTYYTMPALFTDSNGFLALSFSTSGVRLGCYNAVDFNSVAAACAISGPHFAQARWNAFTIEVRVDSGAWQTLARTISASGTIKVGTNYNATGPFNGKYYEAFAEQARWSDGDADDILGYINDTYALSL